MSDTSYHVEVTVGRPYGSSRLWALLFLLLGIKSFALIVQYIVAVVWSIAVLAIFLISQLAVLFTGKYPDGMHRFMTRFLGWSNQLNAWLYGLTDTFPPLIPSGDPHPVVTTITQPQISSRGWAALTILLIKFVALVPHYVVLYVLQVVQFLLVVVANIVILFTAELPEGFADFIVGVMRWQTRVTAFTFGLVDEYPPFALH